MPTITKTAQEAAEQLTRDVTNAWNGGDGNPLTLTYGFRNSAPSGAGNDIMSPDSGGFSKFSATQMKFTELALGMWADVANITFTRNDTVGDYANYGDAELLFANYNSGPATQFASAYAYWDEDRDPLAVWMNGTISGNKNPVIGSFDFETYLHEIGHTLALSHPGDYNASPNVAITYNNDAEYIEDSTQYTVMSYFDEKVVGGNWGGRNAMTPMIHDIAAMHLLYGANMSTRTGDTVYGFNSNEVPLVAGTLNIYAMTSAVEQRIFSVWDAGGTDKFDFSKYTSNSVIDIRNGMFSSVGGLKNNIGIAVDLTGADELIENAIAGAGSDAIIGNKEDNELTGNGGNDTILGDLGNDKLDGGTGNDVLQGDEGDDGLIGDIGIDTASYAHSDNAVSVNLNVQGIAQDTGGEGFDTLSSIENLTGSAENDVLLGDGFANKIDGGGGDDTVEGGGGIDVMIGGANGVGGDTLVYTNAAGVTVNLALITQQDTKGAGRDTISQFENIAGSAFADVLTGSGLINELHGSGGDDTLNGGLGNDELFGDGGNDTLIGGLGSDSIDGGLEGAAGDTASFVGITVAVTASLIAGEATYKNGVLTDTDQLIDIENLIGGSATDKLTGDAGENVIEGGLGNDSLDGDGGSDTISFASATAAVTFSLAAQSNSIAQTTGGAGTDIIFNFENILGGKASDKLTGDANKNTIDGGAGNDLIAGDDEADRLFGGFGIDTISYALSLIGVVIFLLEQGTFDINGDAIDGTAQTGGHAQGDLLWGFENVTGSAFADTLEGDGFANTILGGGGNDAISGLGGRDVLDGGADMDTVDFSYLGVGQNLVLTLGALTVSTGAVAKTSTSGIAGDIDGVANFENVTGGDGNDKITGNAGANKLEGGGGDDRLSGMAANDTLSGGDGNDVLEGGLGDDSIDGEADSDTASYKSSTIGVTVDLSQQGAAQNTIGAGSDTLNNIENLIGSAKNDTLTGDDFDNVIEGGLGNDMLAGGIGTDTLSYAGSVAAVTVSLAILVQQNTVGAGLDTATGFENLTGGAGADKLTGDDKDNVLSGGAGNDTLTGGDGTDTYISGAGADKIIDAGTDGKGDIVYLSGADGVGDTYNLGADSNDLMEFKGATSVTLSVFNAASIEALNTNGLGVVGTIAADTIDFSGFTTVNGTVTIDGLGGNDKITGTLNADTIFGGAGVDTLDGKAGADHLHGGLGLDVLTGGADADTFHIKWGEGADKITDFVSGTDEIELDLAPGMANPLSIISGSAPANAGANAALLYDTDDGRLFYDSGPGVAVQIATLTNVPGSVQLTDFTFI